MPLVIGLIAIAGAVLLLTSGITDASFADVITGKAGQLYRENQPSGTGAGSSSKTSSSSSPNSGIPKVTSPGDAVFGEITQGELDAVAALHGWSPADVGDWLQVIKLESNGTITDTNPSSGAYGIGQMLAQDGDVAANMAKYETYGGNATTVVGQLTGMANYIAQRYGTPANALSFHLANGWY